MEHLFVYDMSEILKLKTEKIYFWFCYASYYNNLKKKYQSWLPLIIYT